MSLAFFTPFFLAGAAFIAIPWIIHHIRRPEREPIKFSSLMFIPKVTREVIERRRIQHLLLMMLRMLILVALALAFARPYLREPIRPGGAEGPEFHIIALDTSFSMGAPNVTERARELALSALDDLATADRVGLITFSGNPSLVVDIAKSAETENPRERIRESINSFAPTQDVTAYIPALRFAQEQLLAVTENANEKEDAPKPRAVIHLVSDFQKSGLPKGNPGWRLSPRVQLRCLDAGTDGIENDAVTGISVRPTTDGKLRIQARVRNGSATVERAIDTRLYLGDKLIESARPQIKPLNSTQVSFTIPIEAATQLEGRVEIAEDLLPVDNARYFAWSEESKRRIVCIADTESEGGWPGWLFLDRAIPHAESDPWIWERKSSSDLSQILASGAARPDVIILSEPNQLDEAQTQGLLSYVSAGGKLWTLLRPMPAPPDAGVANLLDALGVRQIETKTPPTTYSLLSYIDFEHPIFTPLQGERFNDFSQVRFSDYQRLALEGDSTVRVFARFEGDDPDSEPPAMIETQNGEGSAIIWAFSPDPALTNFPRTIKFVPVVMETLNHLTGAGGEATDWFTGQRYTRAIASAGVESDWRVQLPSDEIKSLSAAELAAWEPPLLASAGFMRAGPSGADAWQTVDAVNVRSEESALDRIAVEDFRLRLAAPDDSDAAWMESATESEKVAAGYMVRNEFSRWFLAALFLLLALECWYASRVLR